MKKRLISLLLTLAMVIGLMSGLTVTAYAGGTVYSPASTYTGFDALKSGTDTVTITEVPEKEWYVIGYDSTAGTVTLLAKQSFGDQKFNSNQSSGNSYAGSELESFVLGLIGNNQPLYGIKGALANISVADNPSISGAVPYLLSSSVNEIDSRLLKQIKWDTDWWTRSPSSMYKEKAYYVNSGSKFLDTQAVDNVLSVRPAIQLDLSKLTFNSANNTFSLKPLVPVTYLKWKDSEKSFSEKTTRAYSEVTGSSNPVTWENEGLYVVNSDVTISNQITVKGEVDLILCDGATLTASNGIEVVAGNTLNIYPGSTGSAVSGTGELIATGDDECAGIGGGGGSQICDGGIITIHGGNITASGGSNAAGIGGGNNGSCGTVTIYGGTVAAIGYPADGSNYGCAGIGGGGAGNGGTVAIYAGTVTTIGGGAGGVGIGMAQEGTSNGALNLGKGVSMLVSDDNSTWTSYDDTNRARYMNSTYAPPEPYSYIDENGEEQSCTDYNVVKSNSTAWGSADTTTWYVVNDDVTITGEVDFTGDVNLILCDGKTLTVSNTNNSGYTSGINTNTRNTNFTVYAQSAGDTMGTLSVNSVGGRGFVVLGNLTINGGNVQAAGLYDGIFGWTVTINEGVVTVNGNSNNGVDADKIMIKGGRVTAIGGTKALSGTVKNSIPGSGWANTAGSGASTVIAVNTNGASLNYKKVFFNSHTHTFTNYSASGDTITAVCGADDCPLEGGVATLTIAAPTEGGGAAILTGAGDFADVTVSAIEYSSDNGSTWTTVVPSGDGFYQARVTVADIYTASVAYGVNAIHKAAAENGSFSVPTVAAVGANITIETSPDTGYELDSLTVTSESNKAVAVTKNGNNGSFTMPEENVTVSAVFKKINYTVTVADGITNGTVAVDKTTANYQDEITLTVTPAAGYALDEISVTNATGQAIAVSGGSFTMPASNVNVTATFSALSTYTIFYRASGSPGTVQFRTTDSGDGHNMTNSAKLGDINCWAIQVQAAEGKSKFPVAFSTDGGSTWGSLSDRNVVNDIPNDLAEGDAVVIPGEAKAFIVSFVWGDIVEDSINGGYKAADGSSRNFLATTNTTNVTLYDPSVEGYSFLGWDDGVSANLKQSSNGTVDISGTTESSIYAARWKQNTSTVKFNLNGGSGSISDATVTYGNKVNAPANPTKDGYSFVRWVVARSVSEKINGKETRLSAGTAFNFSDTEIINDLELKAEWKHVHSYVCLQLNDSVFGGAFNDMLEYAPYVHVKICTSMDDYCAEAHKFDSNGKCACGATKPTPTVTLQKTIDDAVESTSTVIKNSVVSINAPQTKNSKQFTKWQYYNGSKWVDLSKNTYTAFVIPANLQVNAVYTGNAAELSVESFNYKGNIAFYFSYKVPNGYTVVDGGILYGNNAHIRYMDAKQLVANVSGMADIMFPYIPSVEMPVHYDPAKDNAVAKFGAQTIANRMFAEQAVNVSGKSTPLFKKLPSFGKSGSTAIAINSSGSNIYYYGMGYVICKAPNGQYAVFMTDAIAATKANPNASTTKTINVQ